MKKIIFFLLIMGNSCLAQINTIKDTTKIEQLQEVIITANRGATLKSEIPVAVSKLSNSLIEETKPSSLYEVINKAPGVLMVNLGNEQHSMAIRQPNSYTGYFLYLEDGLPIRPLGIFNHNALLEINQFSINTIEVVKGPVSSIYGPEAVGGTVNLITKKPTLDTNFKIGLQADQFGYKRMQVGAGSTIGKLGFYVSGLTSDQKDSWLASSDYRKDNINLRLDYAISSNTKIIATVMKGVYDSQTSGRVNEEAFNSREYSSTTDFTYRKSDVLRTRITLDKQWSSNSNTFITLFHRNNKLEQNPSYAIRWNPTPSSTNDPTRARGEINSNDFKSYGILAQHTQKFDFLNSNIIAGLLYDYSPNDYNAYQIDLIANLNSDGLSVNNYQILAERPDIQLVNYEAKIKNSAAYLQYSFNPLEKVKFTLGSRFDQMNFTYDNNIDFSNGEKMYNRFTSKIGVNYNPARNIGFYANYAQGFSPPNLTSIFRKKPGTGTSTVPAEFYYNLEPTQFNNYEIGGFLNLLNSKLFVDYSLYYLQGKNELLSIRQPDNSNDYQSAGETQHKGIELGINYKPSYQWNFRIGGTVAQHKFIDFKISDRPTDPVQRLDGYEMPSAPKWIANSEVSYYPKWLPNLRTSIEWQFISSYYQNQINTVKYEGYNLFNARIGYTYKDLEFFTNVINVTDSLFAYNVSRGNNTTDVSSYTPAAPRTFMFGIQYNLSLSNR